MRTHLPEDEHVVRAPREHGWLEEQRPACVWAAAHQHLGALGHGVLHVPLALGDRRSVDQRALVTNRTDRSNSQHSMLHSMLLLNTCRAAAGIPFIIKKAYLAILPCSPQSASAHKRRVGRGKRRVPLEHVTTASLCGALT